MTEQQRGNRAERSAADPPCFFGENSPSPSSHPHQTHALVPIFTSLHALFVFV